MLAPTPLLKPSPMDISGYFTGAFAVLKQRLGLFVLIMLAPVLITIVAVAAIALVAGSYFAISAQGGLNAGPFILLGVLLLALFIAVPLIQLKSYAMLSAATYEVAQGQHPTFSSLLASTKGFLPRIIGVIVLFFVVVVGVYAALIAAIFGAVASATGGRNESALALGILGIIGIAIVVILPLAFFLGTKWIYLIPTVTIEQAGGIEGLRRSWRLTNGSFWRTFGSYFIASLAVSAVLSVINMVGQLASVPVNAEISQSDSFPQIMASLGALVPIFILQAVVQSVFQLVATPFLQAYLTTMYLDQVRRSEAPAWPQPTPGGYYPGAAPAAPGYPQPGYPQTGWTPPPAPPQAYGQPGGSPQQPTPPPSPGGWQPPSAPPQG